MGRLSKLNFDKVHSGASHPGGCPPNHLWAKAMDGLITSSPSNRGFLNLTWRMGGLRASTSTSDTGSATFLACPTGQQREKKRWESQVAGFFSGDARADLHAILLHGWTGTPGGRVLKKRCSLHPVVALHGTIPSPS